jgi:hypothetical protein
MKISPLQTVAGKSINFRRLDVIVSITAKIAVSKVIRKGDDEIRFRPVQITTECGCREYSSSLFNKIASCTHSGDIFFEKLCERFGKF